MKTIAVIGAGPAGIEAASVMARQGCKVDLYEKQEEPLCNIRDKALLFPNFEKADTIAEALLQKLRHENISLISGHEVQQLERNKGKESSWTVDGRQYDAVILASGYTPFDAHRKEELGYGIYAGVHTSLDMERMLREGRIVNSIGDKPRRVVFLQCVGSRDEKTGNHYCSKLCCVTAVKQAIEVSKMLPDTEVYIFYMDLRMWGQHFEELYRSAQEVYGVKFVRGRISEAAGTYDGRVQIKAEDTLLGLPLRITTDLLVLMVGMEASDGTRKLSQMCGICGEYGFVQSSDPHLNDNSTLAPNLLAAGACKRPMTLTDAINDGRSAACEILCSYSLPLVFNS
ncbi:MAG: CoB--CoM heterodisulfide reductase iron-sulfur subunit A family protein [Bacteroidales bacterium]|nr:CoB--CoM heterodisulfide reductase iron-sulfur subunit A family protein [Bacteroidales bacterium]